MNRMQIKPLRTLGQSDSQLTDLSPRRVNSKFFSKNLRKNFETKLFVSVLSSVLCHDKVIQNK